MAFIIIKDKESLKFHLIRMKTQIPGNLNNVSVDWILGVK